MAHPQPSDSKNSSRAEATCPHCWATFPGNRPLFIAAHDELVGDPVLGEHEHKRLKHTEVRFVEKKILDPKGFVITEYACPECRLQIPRALLSKRARFISMAGAPSSGKSYYIISLLHKLRRQLPSDFNLLFEYAISRETRIVDDIVNRLFEGDPEKPVFLEKTLETGGRVNNRINLNGVAVDLPKPFLFSVRPTPANIDIASKGDALHENLAFYDLAGEHFQYGRYANASNRSFGHFAHSDALIFTYDPLQDSTAIERLATLTKDPQVNSHKVLNRQDNVLEAVIQQFRVLRGLQPTEPINIPLLVCVQKFDVWKGLLPKWVPIDENSVWRSPSEGTSGVDIEELNRNSLHIKRFLQDISPTFVAQAEANFSTVRFFPVSALGGSPTAVEIPDEYDDKRAKLCIRPQDLHPFRVTDPILWLLHTWKVLRIARRRGGKPEGVAEASVVMRDGRVVGAVLPESKERITLDKQYLGTLIVDPYTGTPAWIPGQERKPQGGMMDYLPKWFGGGQKPPKRR